MHFLQHLLIRYISLYRGGCKFQRQASCPDYQHDVGGLKECSSNARIRESVKAKSINNLTVSDDVRSASHSCIFATFLIFEKFLIEYLSKKKISTRF